MINAREDAKILGPVQHLGPIICRLSATCHMHNLRQIDYKSSRWTFSAGFATFNQKKAKNKRGQYQNRHQTESKLFHLDTGAATVPVTTPIYIPPLEWQWESWSMGPYHMPRFDATKQATATSKSNIYF